MSAEAATGASTGVPDGDGVAPRGPGWDAGLPDPLGTTPDDVRGRLAGARIVVVLDDDPTGTQTVRDVPVLTSWGEDDIEWALDQGGPGFFVLTNTRSLSDDLAAGRNREVATACLAVAERRGVRLAFASRGDSTMRGHFPLETDVLRAVAAEHGERVDAVLLSPAYLDAGRITLDGIHWLRGPDGLLAAGASEFARDATFGYTSSRLSDWVEEKSGGRIPAETVRSIPLDALRASTGALSDALLAARDGAVIAIDAVDDDDLRSAVLSVLDAEEAGRSVVYRVGPSFVRARLGQGRWPALDDRELGALRDGGATSRHGLIVVGSHVGLTTRQLDGLRASRPIVEVELSVDEVIDGDAEAHIAEVAARAAAGLDEATTVVSTSRRLRTGADADASLDVSRRVSVALTAAVRRIVDRTRPAYVVAKGGITSSDIATDALGIARARVAGSMLPGIVSVWQATSGRAAGLPYVVFAGNVGDDGSLAQVVGRWERT